MTPIPRPYCNWDAVHRVLETIPSMLAVGDYTTTAAMVLITVARHINQQGLTLASYETFFNEAGIPRSTVKYTLKKLSEAGYLEHVKGTFTYRLGPLVQTFIAENSTAAAKKYSGQQTTPPTTSHLHKILGLK